MGARVDTEVDAIMRAVDPEGYELVLRARRARIDCSSERRMALHYLRRMESGAGQVGTVSGLARELVITYDGARSLLRRMIEEGLVEVMPSLGAMKRSVDADTFRKLSRAGVYKKLPKRSGFCLTEAGYRVLSRGRSGHPRRLHFSYHRVMCLLMHYEKRSGRQTNVELIAKYELKSYSEPVDVNRGEMPGRKRSPDLHRYLHDAELLLAQTSIERRKIADIDRKLASRSTDKSEQLLDERNGLVNGILGEGWMKFFVAPKELANNELGLVLWFKNTIELEAPRWILDLGSLT